MMYIASVFAQLERETIAERVRDNMLMLARSGAGSAELLQRDLRLKNCKKLSSTVRLRHLAS